MTFNTIEELTIARRRMLDDFVRGNWDVLGPNLIEDPDLSDGILFTGCVLVLRSRDMREDVDPGEVILKIHSGIGFSEQLGLLETAAAMMREDSQ